MKKPEHATKVQHFHIALDPKAGCMVLIVEGAGVALSAPARQFANLLLEAKLQYPDRMRDVPIKRDRGQIIGLS